MLMAQYVSDQDSQALHDVVVERQVKIPMRDGTRLDAMVWRPKEPGQYPVIVERVGYELVKRCSTIAEDFARHGYVYVGQNVRGLYASEGEQLAWGNGLNDGWGTHRDGYDTIEWASTQAWSNGKVGMADGSYSGGTQYYAAPTRPPHLAALFVREASADFYRVFRGGALNFSGMLGATIRHVLQDYLEPQSSDASVMEATAHLREALQNESAWQAHLPLKDFPPLRDIPLARYYFDVLDHPDDGPFWWPGRLGLHYAEVDVPIFHLAAWFDPFVDDQIEHFQGISAHGRSAHCRNGQRLLIGPWIHGPENVERSQAGDLDFGPDAIIDLPELRRTWYDHWLKGIQNGAMAGPRVRVFLMGANRWLDLDDWPPADVAYTPVYFRSGTGQSRSSLNNGLLSWDAPNTAEPPDRFTYDPADPISSLTNRPGMDSGPADFRSVEGRLLTYTSAPLERDLTIVGPLRAILHGASSALDTDWVVRVCDLYPDGRSMSVVSGILRARYRNSLERAELLSPGQVYRFEVNLGSTAQSFKAGHCLRVHVTSSDFPTYDRNLNTGGTFGEESVGQVAVNSIFHDVARQSYLVLPTYA
jgi:putative CocE/NonD family hydrolase